MESRAHEVVRGLDRRAAGRAAGVDAQYRLAGAEDIVDRPAVGIGDAHEMGRRKREHDRVDVAGHHAGVFERADGGDLRLLGKRVLGMMRLEFRLESSEYRDSLAHRMPPALSNTTTTLPCWA